MAILDKVDLLFELFLLMNGKTFCVGGDRWSWTLGRHRVRPSQKLVHLSTLLKYILRVEIILEDFNRDCKKNFVVGNDA